MSGIRTGAWDTLVDAAEHEAGTSTVLLLRPGCDAPRHHRHDVRRTTVDVRTVIPHPTSTPECRARWGQFEDAAVDLASSARTRRMPHASWSASSRCFYGNAGSRSSAVSGRLPRRSAGRDRHRHVGWRTLVLPTSRPRARMDRVDSLSLAPRPCGARISAPLPQHRFCRAPSPTSAMASPPNSWPSCADETADMVWAIGSGSRTASTPRGCCGDLSTRPPAAGPHAEAAPAAVPDGEAAQRVCAKSCRRRSPRMDSLHPSAPRRFSCERSSVQRGTFAARSSRDSLIIRRHLDSHARGSTTTNHRTAAYYLHERRCRERASR